MMQSVGQARDVGKKFGITEGAKAANRRHNNEYMGAGSSFTLSGAAEMV
jgi:hypothetical protein